MSRVRMSCSRWFRTVAVVSIIWLVAAEIVMAQAAIRSAPGPRLSKAQWIWDRAHTGNSGKFSCFFRKSFELEGRPSAGIALVTADNNFEFYVNGTLVGSDANPAGTGWNVVEWYEIGHLLQAGKNVLAVKGVNWGQWGGLTVAVRVRHDGAGGDLELWSDETWRMATESGFTKGRIICCTGCRFARGPSRGGRAGTRTVQAGCTGCRFARGPSRRCCPTASPGRVRNTRGSRFHPAFCTVPTSSRTCLWPRN